jgi:NADH:ubiquinone oxidoreductase subunit F (NADH-binding)/Pyruvate/2-oxoacid:ferredoxin oxidoreductase delta subunit
LKPQKFNIPDMAKSIKTAMLKDLIQEVATNQSSEYDPNLIKKIELLSRQRLEKPFIMVGLNTSGRIAGGDRIKEAVEEYISDRELDVEVTETGAIGLASREPILSIQLPGRARILFAGLSEDDVPIILDDIFHHIVPKEKLLGQLRNEKQDPWMDVPFLDEIPFFAHQERLLLRDCGIIDPLSIDEFIARGGYRGFLKAIRYHTCEEICNMVLYSGLRGRSGSGYLTGEKWKVAYNSSADQKYLVCNAEESDPGAFMDRALMEGNPHQLIEGICVASYAIGATKAYIYIRSEYLESIRKLEHAIKDARDYGLLGHNIFNSGFNLSISIRKGPGAFVCGEETALIASMEGRRGMPQSKPPFPAEKGFHRKPTVINNVETLSNVPHIVVNGPEWFDTKGLGHCSGTKIFSVSGKARHTGLIEIPMGANLELVVMDIAGGAREGRELKGIHIGGPSGCLLPADKLNIPVCFDELKKAGAVLGAGGILILDEHVCIVDLVTYFMNFMKQESCGKCIPCREGTKRMSEILNSITRKSNEQGGDDSLKRFKSLTQLENLADVMRDTSLCGLGQMAPNPLTTALKYFRKEFEEHIFERNCEANVCKELRTYFIDVELCTGCTICAKKCPEDAIIGTKKHPYFIVSEKCTGCGICKDVCKFSAVFYN